MIVYVETNFLLELAYEQEGAGSCQALLELARAGSIALAIPVFAIAEARIAWERRVADRKAFHGQLQRQIRELARSVSFQTVGASSDELLTALVSSGEAARNRLEAAIKDVLEVAVPLPLDLAVLAHSLAQETALGLKAADAVIYSTVFRHAVVDVLLPKVFINQNSKDFAIPTIEDELTQVNCKLIARFDDGLKYVRSIVK